MERSPVARPPSPREAPTPRRCPGSATSRPTRCRRGSLRSCASDSSPYPNPNPSQARFLEKLRILLQDEADATQYGGELAPGGPPVGLPYLSLVPIVQMQSVLVRSRDAVADRKQWPALITLLSTGQFETIEFKRIFNQFSDNIYYASDTTEANVYLLGGATPSSGQTQQYLLRNEALKQAISNSYSVISS